MLKPQIIKVRRNLRKALLKEEAVGGVVAWEVKAGGVMEAGAVGMEEGGDIGAAEVAVEGRLPVEDRESRLRCGQSATWQCTILPQHDSGSMNILKTQKAKNDAMTLLVELPENSAVSCSTNMSSLWNLWKIILRHHTITYLKNT